MKELEYQPINPQEREDIQKRAKRVFLTDDDLYQFLFEEREYAMRESLFAPRGKKTGKKTGGRNA